MNARTAALDAAATRNRGGMSPQAALDLRRALQSDATPAPAGTVLIGVGGALRYCAAGHVDVTTEDGATWRRLNESAIVAAFGQFYGERFSLSDVGIEWRDVDLNTQLYGAWRCDSCGCEVRESGWTFSFRNLPIESPGALQSILLAAAKVAEVQHQDAVHVTVIADDESIVFDDNVARWLEPIPASA